MQDSLSKHDRPRTLRQFLIDLTYPVNKALLPYQWADAGTLKTIAAVTMLIDHLTFAFLELPAPGSARLMDTLSNGVLLDALGRMIGRTALPIFAFLIVEGYCYTRNRLRYLLRLLLFAALSAYPFKELFYPYDHAMHSDTLFTLSLGLIAVWVVDQILMRYMGLESRRGADAQADRRSPAAEDPAIVRILQIAVRGAIAGGTVWFCCYLAIQIGADYRYGGVLAVLIYYLFRNLRIVGVLGNYGWLSWYNVNEIYSLVGAFLVLSYNGRRGRQHKYLFYLFYPGHLLLLLILRRMTLGF